jgi:hypothetical protein
LYKAFVGEVEQLFAALDGGEEGCAGRDVDGFLLGGAGVWGGDGGAEEGPFADLGVWVEVSMGYRDGMSGGQYLVGVWGASCGCCVQVSLCGSWHSAVAPSPDVAP